MRKMRSRRLRKALTPAAVVVGLVGVGAATAVAAESGDFGVATEGAAFYGNYEYYPNHVNHGAFHFKGILDDVLNDDDQIYAQVSVAGFGPKTYKGGADLTQTWVEDTRWDPGATRTDQAYIRVCRDTGFPRPDNCSANKAYPR
jgi:hypothetical protein